MSGVHMLFRTLLHLFFSRFGPRLAQDAVGHSAFRVLPTDLDVYKHMNNGVYLSILDIARFVMLRRNGNWDTFVRHGWYPVIASETITFRKSLTLWQKFTVESRTIGFDDKAVLLQQRFVVDGEIYAEAFIRARFLRGTGGTVPIAEVVDAVGASASLPVPEWLLAWGTDVALPPTRAAAPSTWE